ncbi:hypothetical protein VE01_07979 [Pseudogymnoascus verrucosus]|uniref:Uncharacterized protein n=1 Tax=Pseudogymnoascus verrucosus TaxID=342668 RepID=A0A1B8GFF2_9PEZI|nr:uncharacterized protein VE01_07979 [Pseudogymnoascus verrucosus]OBT94562.1 hypothetical protein VE01_07979 [Pseudogymnoascus verrucosus]
MTISSQRSESKPLATQPPPSSKPCASHRMDDYLFDDINCPEDEELEMCEKRRRGLSVPSNRGSELELYRSRWKASAKSNSFYTSH